MVRMNSDRDKQKETKRRTVHTEIAKFRSAYFHVISPNATKYTTKLDKKIILCKPKAVVWR